MVENLNMQRKEKIVEKRIRSKSIVFYFCFKKTFFPVRQAQRNEVIFPCVFFFRRSFMVSDISFRSLIHFSLLLYVV